MVENQSNNNGQARVSVFGAGNAGLTAAFHFTQHGAQVALYGSKGFDEQIHAISVEGGIKSLNEYGSTTLDYSGFEHIDLVTTDVQEAVEYSDVLVLPVPSFAQGPLFRELLPFLTSGQTIVLMPGNYGSLALTKIKNSEGYASLDITFVDAISIPWATRITGNAEIAIFGMKAFLPVAALPASRTAECIKKLQAIFPLQLTPLENVIAAGMENINFGGHPLMTLLNIGLLENFPGKFNYYTDCCSTATANACEILDQERLAVGRALKLNLKSELEAMNELYGMSATSVYELNKTSTTHSSVNSAPDSSRSRYITEDAPYLLVPCAEFAKLLNVEVPIVNSVLHLTSALNSDNYFESGRTLEKMGLSNMSASEVIAQIS
ncbi:NAD/NADP octopine/nopaline dehydrogenase family protein [Cognaticolwellia beringensis]|uniref:Nopaline dehydrogenase n=1 Tax=Cognaticolwellia beringensis TaxID=1967665 RepID=A0A222GCD3_9GAMM|nr:NAD/NADP-dependent octopine/nopaline dehydrogenase family protein [Cognaticolwellia beringensis]ASP49024.1 nopaline dehydrogenase [Cognaticolwellia beringensis]